MMERPINISALFLIIRMAILILNYMIITATLLRSSKSATDNETIYLSDIEGGSYYYMRIFAYGDTAFQEYSLDYAFPVEVSEATIRR